MLTETDIVRVSEYIDKQAESLRGFQGQVAEISQQAARANLTPGETVPRYKPNQIVGAHYSQQANTERARTRAACVSSIDDLLRKARSEITAPTTADALASVDAALENCHTQADFEMLYDSLDNVTLKRRVRSHAAKNARVVLPETYSELVVKNGERAKARFDHLLSRDGGVHPYAAQSFFDTIIHG